MTPARHDLPALRWAPGVLGLVILVTLATRAAALEAKVEVRARVPTLLSQVEPSAPTPTAARSRWRPARRGCWAEAGSTEPEHGPSPS